MAKLDFARGRALAEYERYGEAEAAYRAALVVYGRFSTPAEPGAAAAYVRLALVEVLRRLGRIDEAETEAKAYLEFLRSNEGAQSALTMAEALGALGVLATVKEEYERGRAHHREAIDLLVREAGHGPLEGRERRQLAYSYANEALALCGLGRKDEASKAFTEGLRWQTEPSQLEDIAGVLRENDCRP